MYALNLAEDGRVLSAADPAYAPEDAVTVEALPEGDLYAYRYESGGFVYDPLPKQEAQPEPTAYDELAAAYSEGVQNA